MSDKQPTLRQKPEWTPAVSGSTPIKSKERVANTLDYIAVCLDRIEVHLARIAAKLERDET
jgi:hypothetical protein